MPNIVNIAALNGARVRQFSVTDVAKNIFAESVGPPVVPYVVNNRGVIAVNIINTSANDFWFGYDDTVTDSGGANPGVEVPAGSSASRQVSGSIINGGLWILSDVAGPSTCTIEEFC